MLGLPPVVGSFSDGVGLFEADEMIGGQQVRVRFTWTVHSSTAAHWQQGFSLNQGATWEVNWTMAFTRITADEYARLNAARGWAMEQTSHLWLYFLMVFGVIVFAGYGHGFRACQRTLGRAAHGARTR